MINCSTNKSAYYPTFISEPCSRQTSTERSATCQCTKGKQIWDTIWEVVIKPLTPEGSEIYVEHDDVLEVGNDSKGLMHIGSHRD